MYSKITNPITGRKVSITGKLGRKILKNYLTVLNGGTSSPPSPKVLVASTPAASPTSTPAAAGASASKLATSPTPRSPSRSPTPTTSSPLAVYATGIVPLSPSSAGTFASSYRSPAKIPTPSLSQSWIVYKSAESPSVVGMRQAWRKFKNNFPNQNWSAVLNNDERSILIPPPTTSAG